MKLIQMTDFVLSKKGDNIKYAQFLKQPLTLDMFIGDKALFEKIHESDNFWCASMIENETIEDLLKDDINFTLTLYAIKLLGL